MNYAANYLTDLQQLLGRLDSAAIERAVEALRDARDHDRRVFVTGNGGSAAIASQMVVDIGKGASLDRPKRFKIITLTDQIPWITALANDISYDVVFLEQLKNFAEPGDLLIGMSWLLADVPVAGDPLANLAHAYLECSSYSPVQHDPRKPKENMLLARVRAANAQAVILTAAKMCEPGLEEQVAYVHALEEAKLPYFVSEFEENMSSYETLEIQLETFVENLLFA